MLENQEIWKGRLKGYPPDLFLIPNQGFSIKGTITQDKKQLIAYGSEDKGWRAHHHENGIFLAWGSHVCERNTKIKNGANIIDIAPTILSIFDIDIPKYMNGKILVNRNEKA